MENTEKAMTYAEALTAYLKVLTETEKAYFAARFSNLNPPSFSVEPGRSFDKIVVTDGFGNCRSVHSFVAKKDGDTKSLGARKAGDIMKAATWKAPARHPRGSIFGNVTDAFGGPGATIRYL